MGFADHPAASSNRVAELGALDAATFRAEVAGRSTPVVLRGQVKDWKAVERARAGDRAIAEYLAGFGGGRPLKVLIGPPEIGGHFFYRDDMRGFNFQRQQVPLPNLVGELLKLAEQQVESPQAIYADAAAAPEKKSGPPRALIVHLGIAASFLTASAIVVTQAMLTDPGDAAKLASIARAFKT